MIDWENRCKQCKEDANLAELNEAMENLTMLQGIKGLGRIATAMIMGCKKDVSIIVRGDNAGLEV